MVMSKKDQQDVIVNWIGKIFAKELMKDGSLEDNITSDSIDCINDHIHNPTRGTYLLTPSEVADLEKHPKVEYVNLNYRVLSRNL